MVRRATAASARVPGTNLKSAAVKPVTNKRYTNAVDKFLDFLLLRRLTPLSPQDVDKYLDLYIQHIYDTGGSRSSASYAVNGLCHLMPELKGHLVRSNRSLKGWIMMVPPTSKPPFSYKVVVVAATGLVGLGFIHDAIGVLLAFDCYLRVSELTRIVWRDIAVPGDSRLEVDSTEGALRIATAKTGDNQFVTIRHPALLRLLPWLRQRERPSSPDQRVFPFSAAQFRQRLHKVCTILKLQSIGYGTHSLRRGGATHDAGTKNLSIETILHRGRWASKRSAHIYVHTGRAVHLQLDVPEEIAHFANEIEPRLFEVMTNIARNLGL